MPRPDPPGKLIRRVVTTVTTEEFIEEYPSLPPRKVIRKTSKTKSTTIAKPTAKKRAAATATRKVPLKKDVTKNKGATGGATVKKGNNNSNAKRERKVATLNKTPAVMNKDRAKGSTSIKAALKKAASPKKAAVKKVMSPAKAVVENETTESKVKSATKTIRNGNVLAKKVVKKEQQEKMKAEILVKKEANVVKAKRSTQTPVKRKAHAGKVKELRKSPAKVEPVTMQINAGSKVGGTIKKSPVKKAASVTMSKAKSRGSTTTWKKTLPLVNKAVSASKPKLKGRGSTTTWKKSVARGSTKLPVKPVLEKSRAVRVKVAAKAKGGDESASVGGNDGMRYAMQLNNAMEVARRTAQEEMDNLRSSASRVGDGHLPGPFAPESSHLPHFLIPESGQRIEQSPQSHLCRGPQSAMMTVPVAGAESSTLVIPSASTGGSTSWNAGFVAGSRKLTSPAAKMRSAKGVDGMGGSGWRRFLTGGTVG